MTTPTRRESTSVFVMSAPAPADNTEHHTEENTADNSDQDDVTQVLRTDMGSQSPVDTDRVQVNLQSDDASSHHSESSPGRHVRFQEPQRDDGYEFPASSTHNAPDTGESWTDSCGPLTSRSPCQPNSCSSPCALKLLFMPLLAFVVTTCGVISKVIILFTASQMNMHVKFKNAVESNDSASCGIPVCLQDTETDCLQSESTRWVWCMYLCQCVPDLISAFLCLLKICFKHERKPALSKLLWVLLFETAHVLGLFTLLYTVLPYVDVMRGLVLLTCVALLPSILQTMQSEGAWQRVLSIMALLTQIALPWLTLGLPLLSQQDYNSWDQVCHDSYQHHTSIIWHNYNDSSTTSTTQPPPTTTTQRLHVDYNYTMTGVLPEEASHMWKPLFIYLISMVYWENFITHGAGIPALTNWFHNLHKELIPTRAVTYFIVGIYKCLLTFILILIYYGAFYDLGVLFDTDNLYENKCGVLESEVRDNYFQSDWLEVSAVSVSVAVAGFFVSDLVIKADMQRSSFTLPLYLVTPLSFLLMLWPCEDCNFTDTLYYWNCQSGYVDVADALIENLTWIGMLGTLSTMWIVRHLWFPESKRLARTDVIFTAPFPCGPLLDQSLALIRNSHDDEFSSGAGTSRSKSTVHPHPSGPAANLSPPGQQTYTLSAPFVPTLEQKFSRGDTFIYFCATMWHETRSEMLQLLQSLFRMNNDQVCRQTMKDDHNSGLNDYYQFQAHIFFDDAFTVDDKVNDYVQTFIDVVDEACNSVLDMDVQYKSDEPITYSTAYGGKILWTMPFKQNQIVLHMKNKKLIRKGKRWSQIMYMHYILGECILSHRDVVTASKLDDVVLNTYILALDGDVDFKPESVRLLLDLMKSHPKVAAACGRIHPVGSGPMVWYQKFEYSISHWLQKSTEHVLGCVLCSPGCFSLFRCSALIEVAHTYQQIAREPPEFVQYDQGEDRWLCTLLLQHGFRVEYCAASDAYTNAPDGFDEFFKQRRRWITSTFANIIDLLRSGKTTAENNDSISILYIVYQMVLFVSSILGPGTIFLLLIDTVYVMIHTGSTGSLAFVWILLIGISPFLIYILLCYHAKQSTQLYCAAILSTIFGVVQVLVLVGVISQVVNGGLCSPSTMFLLFILGTFVLSALLHPSEGSNLVHLLTFYLMVPSTYLLLIIYSLCNVNDVSWGTRETTTQQPLANSTSHANMLSDDPDQSWPRRMLSRFTGTPAAESSGCSLSCRPLFTCRCCLSAGDTDDNQHISVLGEQIMDIKEDLDFLRKKKERKRLRRGDLMEETGGIDFAMEEATEPCHTHDPSPQPECDQSTQHSPGSTLPAQQHTTLNFHEIGQEGNRDDIAREITFWERVVREDLYPNVKYDKQKLQEGLLLLRNKCVFAFFMLNLLMIVLVLGLQIVELSIPIYCGGGSTLLLDPVGVVFICVFGIILMLQIIGMVVHRMYTVVQLISTAVLCLPKTNIDDDDNKKVAVKDEHFLQLFKDTMLRQYQEESYESEEGESISILHRKSQVLSKCELDELYQKKVDDIKFQTQNPERTEHTKQRRVSTQQQLIHQLRNRGSVSQDNAVENHSEEHRESEGEEGTQQSAV